MSSSRRNSFFGLDSPKSLDLSLSSPEVGFSASNAAGEDGKGEGGSGSKTTHVVNGIDNDVGLPHPSTTAAEESGDEDGDARKDTEGGTRKPRPSSFFGMQQPLGHVPNPQDGSGNEAGQSTPDPANTNRESCPSPTSLAPSQSASNYGGSGERINNANGGANRPISVAPTLSGALLDHSHLRPGESAALLSHNKTLELYRQNAKKTNDPELIFELAVFMIEAAKSMGGDDSSGGTGPAGSGSSNSGHMGKDEGARDDLVKEAIGLLKKIADRGHPDAQYFLADCFANGIGTAKGKHDFDKAYPLFVLAAKHGHPDAAYRAAMCYEKGWGCRRDASKAVQFYRKAGAQGHPGAMYRLGTAELNGDLNLKKSAREGVKWLKRSAEAATPEFPHALHELALLHERGVDNVLFADPDYACELLAQAGEMGYAPSAYKLGVNYEYGRMGCPQDAGLSIHMYNIAAQQNHKEACFALTAWYLVGAPGILPQSDTEAYLWAKKAAEQGLAKAEYAVGYFTEMGIGTVRDMTESRSWYRLAAEHGDKRANQRLISLGVLQPETNRLLASLGLRRGSEPASTISQQQQQQGTDDQDGLRSGEPPLPQKPHNAREQGLRVAAAAEALRLQQQKVQQQQQQQQAMAQRAQPSSAPFISAPLSGAENGQSYPNPMQMREVQTAQREQAHQQAIVRTQQQQQQQPPPQGLPRPPMQMGQGPGAQPRSSFSSQHSASSQQRPIAHPWTSPPIQNSSPSFNPRSPPQKNPMMMGGGGGGAGARPPSSQGTANGSDVKRMSPAPSTTSPTMSPQLAQQFQNMHMRGPPSASSHASSSQDSARQSSSVGGRPPNGAFGPGGRAPHGAEVAYLQHPRPSPPPGHYVQRPHQHLFNALNGGPPPFRGAPPQRQNSAPPGGVQQNGGTPPNFSRPPPPQAGGMYPTYAHQPNPERNYRPGIPVVHQPLPHGPYPGGGGGGGGSIASAMSPPPSDIGSHVSTEADSTGEKRKMGLWAQLKAI